MRGRPAATPPQRREGALPAGPRCCGAERAGTAGGGGRPAPAWAQAWSRETTTLRRQQATAVATGIILRGLESYWGWGGERATLRTGAPVAPPRCWSSQLQYVCFERVSPYFTCGIIASWYRCSFRLSSCYRNLVLLLFSLVVLLCILWYRWN